MSDASRTYALATENASLRDEGDITPEMMTPEASPSPPPVQDVMEPLQIACALTNELHVPAELNQILPVSPLSSSPVLTEALVSSQATNTIDIVAPVISPMLTLEQHPIEMVALPVIDVINIADTSKESQPPQPLETTTATTDPNVMCPEPEVDTLAETLKRYLTVSPAATPLEVVAQIRDFVSPLLCSSVTDANQQSDSEKAKIALKVSFACATEQNWFPRLLHWCTDQDNIPLQYESVWVLSNLAFLSDADANRLIDWGAFEICVTILQGIQRKQTTLQSVHKGKANSDSGLELMKLITQVNWLLRNLTTTGVQACRRALHAGVLQIVLQPLKNLVQGMLYMIQQMPVDKLTIQLQSTPMRATLELLETSTAVLSHMCQFQPLHDIIGQHEADLLFVFGGCLAFRTSDSGRTETGKGTTDTTSSSSSSSASLVHGVRTQSISMEKTIVKLGAFGLKYLFDSSTCETSFPVSRYEKTLVMLPDLLNRMHQRMEEFVEQRSWDLVYAVLWAWTGLSFGPEKVVSVVLAHPLVQYLLHLVANVNVHKDARFLRMHTMCAVLNLMMLDDTQVSSPDVKSQHVQLALNAGVIPAVLGTMYLGALDVCEYALNILAGLCHYADKVQKVHMVQQGALLACEHLLLKYQDPKHALKDDVISAVRIVAMLASECVEMRWPESSAFRTIEKLPVTLQVIESSQIVLQRDDVSHETRDAQIWLRELYAVPERPPTQPTNVSKRNVPSTTKEAVSTIVTINSSTSSESNSSAVKKPTAKIRKQQLHNQSSDLTSDYATVTAPITVRPNKINKSVKSKTVLATGETTSDVSVLDDTSATSVSADQPRSKKPKSEVIPQSQPARIPSKIKATSSAKVSAVLDPPDEETIEVIESAPAKPVKKGKVRA